MQASDFGGGGVKELAMAMGLKRTPLQNIWTMQLSHTAVPLAELVTAEPPRTDLSTMDASKVETMTKQKTSNPKHICDYNFPVAGQEVGFSSQVDPVLEQLFQ